MSNNVEQELRRQLQEISQKLRATEFNLEAQRIEVKQLNNLYFKLKDDYNVLSVQKNQVDEKLRIANENYNRAVRQRNRLREQFLAGQNAAMFEPIIFNKPWNELKCTASKRKRKKIYRSIIDRSLKQIVECSMARVFLRVGKETIAFQWSEQEIDANREDMSNQGYILPPNTVPPCRNRRFADHVLYSERRDDEFHITHTKEEIRKVIYVMDLHTIAYPGYHELHMLSHGILPPLNQIKQQKKEMSEHLNFYVVPGVSSYYVNINFLDYNRAIFIIFPWTDIKCHVGNHAEYC